MKERELTVATLAPCPPQSPLALRAGVCRIGIRGSAALTSDFSLGILPSPSLMPLTLKLKYAMLF